MPKSVFKPPSKLEFKTDGNIIQFQEISPKQHNKKPVYIYKYIHSPSETKPKLGMELPMTEDQITDLINKNIAKKVD